MSEFDNAASLLFHMAPLKKFMEMDGVTEVAMNRPGWVHYEQGPVWIETEVPEMDANRCMDFAVAVASFTNQQINKTNPLLDAELPGGERIKIVIPPAAEKMSITIRVPGPDDRELDQYEPEGAFKRVVWAESSQLDARMGDLLADDRILVGLLREGRHLHFLKKIVEFHKNIAVVGDTGSGKTTLMKAMARLIDPMERILTIEDTRELFLPLHRNQVNLLYSQGGQGIAAITPADLIRTTLRMKPDRVLLAENRGAEAYDLLKLLMTGHKGSMTSYHAESCAVAAERFCLMAREHPQAQAYSDEALKRLVFLTLDVIIHVTARPIFNDHGVRVAKERFVTEIYFDPVHKLGLSYGDARLHVAGK
ncbi:P-type DNA transfer ATPase VirB11 [Burkholderia ubonensis]|uniref:P-type DNA transfer ATPase VirB11 n=1 Tax=Burkholderia ubonensis TaxID=101571 RepID=UPI002AB23445|nr:P-type DNA transfer ATPase VirB11 [Burkholderia ubonensis]